MKRKKLYILFIVLYTLLSNFSIVSAESVKNLSSGPPEIFAESAILIDAKTGLVVYEKNANAKNYPASITKIMTGLLAIEYANGNYDQRVIMSQNAVFSLPPGSSHIAMNDNETLSMNECLYAIFLASANEVSNAVAEYVSGTTENFAKRMTERAKELGAKNTNFLNPHGLHDENHYTTAFDMAMIMKECVKHPEFLKYISTLNYNIPPTERQPEQRVLYNSNKMIIPSSAYNYEYCVGGKTGYTDEAKHTLVTYSEKNDLSLICVVLKDDKSNTYKDTINLFNYGFELFENQKILSAGIFNKKINIKDNDGNNVGYVETYINDDIYLSLPKNIDKNKIEIIDNLNSELNKSVKKDEILGKLKVQYEDIKLAEIDIFASNTVEIPKTEEKTNSDTVISQSMAPAKNDEASFLSGMPKYLLFIPLAFLVIFLIVRIIMYFVLRRRYRQRRLKFNYKSINKYKD